VQWRATVPEHWRGCKHTLWTSPHPPRRWRLWMSAIITRNPRHAPSELKLLHGCNLHRACWWLWPVNRPAGLSTQDWNMMMIMVLQLQTRQISRAYVLRDYVNWREIYKPLLSGGWLQVTISSANTARNLGLVLDSELSMTHHISSVFKSCFLSIRIPQPSKNYKYTWLHDCSHYCYISYSHKAWAWLL
jgi:hypothetical protein